MSAESLVGKRNTRLDAVAKVTGQYEYGMDFHLPGALESVVLRSPFPHALITRLDTSRAEALEGVRGIITGKDLPGLLMLGPVEDMPLLAVGRVRFWGEPVALVAAETLEIAEAGARLIEVEYEPLPVVVDPEEAMQAGAVLLHPDWRTYKEEDDLERHDNVCGHSQVCKGDVAKGFAEADYIIEEDFFTQSVHQSHVEPRAATAVVERDGTVTVHCNTQLPYWIRTNVAHVLGVPEEQVRIVLKGIGGGFGSKLYPQIEPLVALLASKTGRAVHMVTPLEEELTSSLPRHPSKIHMKTGVKKDGSLTAIQARAIVDSGAYAGSGPEIAGMEVLMLAGLYRVPNILTDGYAVYTNKMNFGAYRGPGGVQAVFALESHIDTIAAKLGIDPLTYRLNNLLKEGEDAPSGQILQGFGLREALEKTAAAIEWDQPAGPNRGKGLAISWWTTTVRKSTCTVEVDREGRILVSVGTQDLGTGAIMGGVPVIVAETLGVGIEDVTVEVADTSKGLWDWGSQGSRTLFNVGLATQLASLALGEKLKNLASHVLEVSPDELELKEKAVVLKANPSERVSLAKLARLAPGGSLVVRQETDPEQVAYDKSRVKGCLYVSFNYPNYHCHAAEVEVDPGTGQVHVVRYAAAHDIGFAINPTLVEGQIQGGAAQGIGMALMEEIQYENGYRKNINWTDYKLPTMGDIPDIQAIIVEHPIAGGGPFGMKGLGDSTVIEPAAAVANAVARAIGKRIHSLPITAEKVLKTIRDL